MRPKALSEAAKAARRPPPPAQLVGALQDRIHIENGRLLAAVSINVKSQSASQLGREAERRMRLTVSP